MKSKNKIYKFSAADVVLYIKDHVNMADDVVSIIKKNTKSLDQKTINKLSIVNDVVKHIGNLITYAQENIVLEDNVFENTKSNITKVTTIIDMIITGIISKIVKFSLLSFVTLPAIILCKIQIRSLVSLIKFIFKRFGLLTILKISILKKAFENIQSIVDNISYITKELTKLGILAIIGIPALFKSINFMRVLNLFIKSITYTFKLKKLVTIVVLKKYFEIFEYVTDSIINISLKLIKLGMVSILTTWTIKAARKFVMQLSLFNKLILVAFNKRHIIALMVLNKYFDVLYTVVNDLILISGRIRKLGFASRWMSGAIKKSIKYIIKLSMLVKLITTLFSIKDAVKLKITKIGIKALYNIINTLSSISASIIKLGIVSLLAKPFFKLIRLYLLMLRKLVKSITRVFGRIGLVAMIKTNIKFRILRSIFKHLIAIAIESVLLAAAAIIATPALLLDIVFVLTLTLFIKALQIMLRIAKIKLKDIFRLIAISFIFKQLITLAIESALLAAAAIIATPALLLNIVFILTLTLFIKVLQIMLRIARIKLKDILGLTVIGIALGILIVIAIEIKKLNDVASQIKWKNLFVIMGAILLVAVFSIMIGFAAITILPIIAVATVGLLSIVIVVGLIVLVAVALQYLQSIQLDSEAVKNNVRLILGCAKDIINMLVEDETERPEEEKGWLSNALKSIGGATSDIISIILRFGTLAMALLSVGVIYLIAGILSELQNIKLDREKILGSVQIVMDTAKMITNVLFDKDVPNENEPANDKKGVVQSLIDFVGGSLRALSGLIESIVAVPVLFMTIMSVGMVFVIANMLNKVMTIQLDPGAIRAKINGIIGVAMNISSMINGTYEDPATKPKEEKKGFFAKLGEGAKDMVLGVAKGAMSVVENLAGAGVLASVLPCILSLNTVVSLLDSVNKLKFNPANTKTKVNDIIDVAKSIGVIVSNKDGEIATVDENKVKQYGKFVDYSESYIKTINKLDVSKVKSLGDMYEKMGQFMEKLQDAPINDIADALVNKISPALSSINTSLNKKPTPTNSTNNTSNTQITQTTPNNPITSNQPVKQIDYSGILENIEGLLEQIKKKLSVQPAF